MSEVVEIIPKTNTKSYLFAKGNKLSVGKGRGKGNLSMSTLLKNALHKMATGEAMTPAEKITMSLLRQSETGNLKAIEMVLDRTEGKPVQQVQQVNINIEPLKDEQKQNLLKLLEND